MSNISDKDSHLLLASISGERTTTFERQQAKSGGGDDNGSMSLEARVAKLESAVTDTRERVVRIEAAVENLATKHDLENLRSDVVKMNFETVKWIVGTAMALGAAAITVMTFVLNNAVPRPSPQAQQLQPIVIQAPTNQPATVVQPPAAK